MRHRSLVQRAGVAAAALVALACGASADPDRGAPGTRALSAPLADAAPLRLLPTPVQRFGGMRGDPDLELNARNGLLSATFTADGGIAVIDGARVHRFGPSGDLLAASGRVGSGPGESRLFSSICLTRGDSLLAFDVSLRRMSVFSPTGALARQYPSPARGLMPEHGCLDDGTALLLAVSPSDDGTGAGELIRMTPDGEVLGEPIPVPMLSAVAFTSVSAVRTVYWVASPQSRTITRHRADGSLDLTLELAEPLRPMSASEVERSRLIAPAAGRGTPDGALPDPSGQVAPLYSRAVAAGEDRLWLELPTSDFRAPARWVGVHADGGLVGRIVMPASTGMMSKRVIAFAGDKVLVLDRDADGVAWFEVFRIEFAR